MVTKKDIASVASVKARIPFHGFMKDSPSNLKPIIDYFPKWNILDADKLWCAAFVYYCCREAGFVFPYSPKECVSCSLAGCGGWEEFAMKDKRILYFKENLKIQNSRIQNSEIQNSRIQNSGIQPEVGDIVLFDFVFCNREHDHIGILLEVEKDYFMVAEGNYGNTNCSGIIKRKRDNHIRAFIRFPDGYSYDKKENTSLN